MSRSRRCSLPVVTVVVLSAAFAVKAARAAPKDSLTREYPHHLEALRDPELGDLMNALLRRCLAVYWRAQAELRATLSDPSAKPKKVHGGVWAIIRSEEEMIYRIDVSREDGPVQQVTKLVYSDMKTASEVPGAGYTAFYRPAGKLWAFTRRTHGEGLRFHPNGRVKTFFVTLAKKSSFEAEWDVKGKLLREGVRRYP